MKQTKNQRAIQLMASMAILLACGPFLINDFVPVPHWLRLVGMGAGLICIVATLFKTKKVNTIKHVNEKQKNAFAAQGRARNRPADHLR